MKAALSVHKNDAASFDRSFEEKVRLYYFTFDEAVSLLNVEETVLRKLLGCDRYDEVRRDGHWMIPPDQIHRIRLCMWRVYG